MISMCDEQNQPIFSSLSGEGKGVLKLVIKFVEQLPMCLEEIRHLFDAGDWDKLASSVHKLKGTGGNFGFIELSKVAESIELLSSEKSYDDVKAQLDLLDNLQSRIQAGAKQYKL